MSAADALRWQAQDLAGHREVRVEGGLYRKLWSRVAQAYPAARRVGFVADEQVLALWPGGAPVDLELVACALPPGEAAKDRAVLARVQDALLELRRDEPVVVLGGGAALDVGGFAAATVRRGLPWIAVPSTVVAMADAAIGGKVGINHPRGKNLLGTFHAAERVWVDFELLSTLASRDIHAGCAELYKCGYIGDEQLRATLALGVPGRGVPLVACIERAIRVKARCVEHDMRDHGARRALNFGHTIGHALEALLGPEQLRHGEGVAIGMCVAARLGVARGLLTGPEADRLRQQLVALHLPVEVPAGVERTALLAVLGLDKKRRSGQRHTWVLPRAQGVEIHEDVTEAEIQRALG